MEMEIDGQDRTVLTGVEALERLDAGFVFVRFNRDWYRMRGGDEFVHDAMMARFIMVGVAKCEGNVVRKCGESSKASGPLSST